MELFLEEINNFKKLSNYDYYDVLSEDIDDKELDNKENKDVLDKKEEEKNDLGNDLDSEFFNDNKEEDGLIANNEDNYEDEEVVELDISDVIEKIENTNASVVNVGTKIDLLLQNYIELENSMKKMDDIYNNVEKLINIVNSRLPSEKQELEMRSLDSFPYSMKLTDFWKEKEDEYKIKEPNDEEEYVLTDEDIDEDYNESFIEKTF